MLEAGLGEYRAILFEPVSLIEPDGMQLSVQIHLYQTLTPR